MYLIFITLMFFKCIIHNETRNVNEVMLILRTLLKLNNKLNLDYRCLYYHQWIWRMEALTLRVITLPVCSVIGEHVCTIEAVQLLCVQEGCGSPDTDCAVVRSAGHKTGNTGVPADAVHCACVSRQLHDRQLAALVPNIYLMIWETARLSENDSYETHLKKEAEE